MWNIYYLEDGGGRVGASDDVEEGGEMSRIGCVNIEGRTRCVHLEKLKGNIDPAACGDSYWRGVEWILPLRCISGRCDG